MTTPCNCMVLWNPATERHEWVHAALSSCEHPPTGDPRPTTDELLGADPEWTGGLSVDDYMDQARRR